MAEGFMGPFQPLGRVGETFSDIEGLLDTKY